MRLDRLITLTLAGQRRWLASPRDQWRLPILMYHSISGERQLRAAYFQTVTHPDVFAGQMQLLAREGYMGVTLSDGLDWLRSSDSDPRKPVVLTFDDGFRDFLTAAVPVLQRYGFRATAYLPTGFIDRQRRQFNHCECLTWSEVAALHSAGFEFGSHTVTHPRLVELGWENIRMELAASKNAIEDHLHSPVTAFAYPYAFPQEKPAFGGRFAGLLREVGYRSCVTTKIGRVASGDESMCLRRLPVNSCDDPGLLRAKLDGAYDWMAPAQVVLRRIKGLAARVSPAT